MFAMLHGAWPRVTADGIHLAALESDVAAGHADGAAFEAATERLVSEVVTAQVDAGMGLVTDGHVRWTDPAAVVLAAVAARTTGETGPLVAAWKAGAAVAPVSMLAQAIPGPYSLSRRVLDEAVRSAEAAGETPPDPERQGEAQAEVALAIADALAIEIGALAAAGCQVILVEEPEAIQIVADGERALFVAAGTRLLAQVGAMHAMLVLTGGSADAIGWRTVFGPPWQSLLVDLIDGPDSWRLVREAPGDRGIIAGGLSLAEPDGTDQTPQLVWAAHYAASANGRGFDRVGLANAQAATSAMPGSLPAAMTQLATAARLATMTPPDAVAAGLNPNAIADPRTMPALGNRDQRRRQAKTDTAAKAAGRAAAAAKPATPAATAKPAKPKPPDAAN
jgi:hypothetical protein